MASEPHNRRLLDALGPIESTSMEEALRAHTGAFSAPFEIGLTDLVTAIVLEPDILRHLVEQRDLTVDLRALRKKRNPAAHATQQGTGGDSARTVTLVEAEPAMITHSREYTAVFEALASWDASDAGRRDFAVWEPRRRFEPPADPPADFIEQARAAGLADDQARQMYHQMFDPVHHISDDAWRQRLRDRNYRYAVLRELFRGALKAGREEVEGALHDMRITVVDLEATFDSLAMNYRYPNL